MERFVESADHALRLARAPGLPFLIRVPGVAVPFYRRRR
jgi:hypothetical protein